MIDDYEYYYDDDIPLKYQKLDPDIELYNYNQEEKDEFDEYYYDNE